MSSGDLPAISMQRPFKAVVIVEQDTAGTRRETICDWLIESGCLYCMAWGDDCEDWVETIERVNRAAHDSGEIPDDHLVIATAHADETLEQVFWFSKFTALHPCANLTTIMLVHLSPTSCEQEFLAALERA